MALTCVMTCYMTRFLRRLLLLKNMSSNVATGEFVALTSLRTKCSIRDTFTNTPCLFLVVRDTELGCFDTKFWGKNRTNWNIFSQLIYFYILEVGLSILRVPSLSLFLSLSLPSLSFPFLPPPVSCAKSKNLHWWSHD